MMISVSSFRRHGERSQAMHQLMKMTRDNCAAIWDDHFKTILLLLLETLGDNDVRVNDRCSATHCICYEQFGISGILDLQKNKI